MKAIQSICQMLEKTVLRLEAYLDNGNESSVATAFFISPGVAITARHGIYNEEKQRFATFKLIWGTTLIENATPKLHPDDIDLAYLEIPVSIKHPCVLIDDECEAKTPLCLFGYSKGIEGIREINLDKCGKGHVHGHNYVIMKDYPIESGFSGAPILNTTTGAVCGIVILRSRIDPYGGIGLSASTFFRNELDNHYLSYCAYHLENTKWSHIAPLYSRGLGAYDSTLKENHFVLNSPDRVTVSDLFIDPICFYRTTNEPEKRNRIEKGFIEKTRDFFPEHRMLFFFGPYGSGKTIASKMLQYKLLSIGKDCLFIPCVAFSSKEAILSLLDLANERKREAKELYIIFDSYDESNFAKDDEIEIRDTLLENIFSLLSIDGVYIVINSRWIFQAGDDDLITRLALQFEKCSPLYYEFDCFDTKSIISWMDSYYSAIAKHQQNRESRLFYEDIKSIRKGMLEACRTPLFLYMLNSFFSLSSHNTEDIANIPQVYSTFIDLTIEGKYFYELYEIKSFKRSQIKSLVRNYRDFLLEFAKIYCSINVIDRECRIENKWILDENRDNKWIDNCLTREQVENTIAKIAAIEKPNDYDFDRLTINVMNCYFFEWDFQRWRFRDKNIAHYLVSEDYYNNILALLDARETERKTRYQGFKSYFDENMHIPAIEFLLLKISFMPIDEKKELANKILMFIEKGYFLQLNKNSFSDISKGKINSDLVISLIFLILNESGYGNIGYYFKRLSWYTSFTKRIQIEYLNLVRRCFQRTHIAGVELRRINLDKYNFNGGKWKDTSFIQCKFHKALMSNIEAANVRFLLSDINDVEMHELHGDIHFVLCSVVNLRCEHPMPSVLRFEHCYIKELIIHGVGRHAHQAIDIYFEKCDIGEFIFRGGRANALSLKQCFYQPLKLEGSKVKLNIVDSICLGETEYKIDTSSDVIAMINEISYS